MNNLFVAIYQAYSTTERVDVDLLPKASSITYSTYFPAGMYGAASVFIPSPISDTFLWQPGDRMVIRNGLTIVWEGELSTIGYGVGDGAQQGITLEGVGYWGALLGKRTVNRRWCDTRTTQDAWNPYYGGGNRDRAFIDRNVNTTGVSKLRITPKREAFPNASTGVALIYSMPTNESVGRIAGTYDFKEDVQAWRFRLIDGALSSSFWDRTSTASASFDTDNPAGTNSQHTYLQWLSNTSVTQTPASDKVYYGEVTGIKVYRYQSDDGTVPNVRINTIAKNCIAAVTNINSTATHLIDTPGTTLDIEPFMTNGNETWASVLERAAAYGDGAFNQWYIRLMDSEQAATPIGKPVMEVKQYPALTSYDYAVRIDGPNVLPPVDIRRTVDNMRNYLVINWTNPAGGLSQKTPDDNSNLKDSTSITDWGQREMVVNLSRANSTSAINTGRKILAARKNPQWYVNGPLTVRGYIEGSAGERIPASEIQAGKRVKILNFLDDLAPSGASGAGFTDYIASTYYDDSTETCQMSIGGLPDNLAVILAQLQLKYV